MRKGRKISGGRYIQPRKKKLYELPGQKRTVKLGNIKGRSKRTRGGNLKNFMLTIDFVNVISKGKAKKAKIKNVLETPSNRFLARQNIITKGTIVDTEIGKVRITNRPSHEGVLNGVLAE
ncbi:MAG: 30S ribosomal protein S8e [Candidatus Pacearchaeota archaeon]